MENEKNYKYIIVVIISICLFFSTAFFLGTSLSANRRYRTELERNTRLEQTIRESSECIRRTSDELGDLIQSSNGRIESSIEGVQSLRETMQSLENDYNNMRNKLLDIYGNINGVVD